MNDLIQFGETHNVQGMTSLQIAEVTGKNHAHVMRDIRNLLEQGVNESNFGLEQLGCFPHRFLLFLCQWLVLWNRAETCIRHF